MGKSRHSITFIQQKLHLSMILKVHITTDLRPRPLSWQFIITQEHYKYRCVSTHRTVHVKRNIKRGFNTVEVHITNRFVAIFSNRAGRECLTHLCARRYVCMLLRSQTHVSLKKKQYFYWNYFNSPQNTISRTHRFLGTIFGNVSFNCSFNLGN